MSLGHPLGRNDFHFFLKNHECTLKFFRVLSKLRDLATSGSYLNPPDTHRVWKIPLSCITWKTPKNQCWKKSKQASGTLRGWKPTYCPNRGYLSLSWFSPQYQLYGIVDALKSGIRKKIWCHSRSCSRSFPGITTSHSRSQNSGMEFPFPFPFPNIARIANAVPVTLYSKVTKLNELESESGIFLNMVLKVTNS